MIAYDHDQLKALAKNPGLIEKEDDLNALLQHIDICSDCSMEVNRSVAFFETAIEPLSNIGPHPPLIRLYFLRLKGFVPTHHPANNLVEWHVTICPQCRKQYDELKQKWQWHSVIRHILQPSIPKLAFVTMLLVVSAFLYFQRTPKDNEIVYRSPSGLSLLKPEDNTDVRDWQTFTWEQPRGRSVTFIIKSAQDDTTIISHTLKNSSLSLLPSDVSQLRFNDEYIWYITMATDRGLVESTKRHFRFVDQSR